MQRSVKSVVLHDFGNYDKIKIENFPLPEPNENEVEVDVHYCGLNFCDIVTRVGLIGQKLPFILGIECSGVVTALGPQSNDFPELKVGDHVVCYNFLGGLYREKVVVPRKYCYLLPEGISLKDGVTLFVNYLTAYFCLFERGHLRDGDTVLIKSCAGGVGWAATQLAHTVPDVTVYGTASNFKHDEVIANGVHHALSTDTDYISTAKNVIPSGFNLIIENETPKSFSYLTSLLKPLGTAVFIGANNIIENENKLSLLSYFKLWWNQKSFSLQQLMMHNHTVSGLHLGLLAEQNPIILQEVFKKICDLFLRQKIKPKIDSEWDIDNIIDATKRMGERKNIGKIVIKINKD